MAAETAEEEKTSKGEDDLGADPKEEEKKEAEGDEKVPLRQSAKTNAEFARTRVALKGKKGGEDAKTGTDEEDPDLTPQVRKLIEKQVREQVAPLEDRLAFRDYFAEHPEDKKFEKQAKERYDAWGNVPIEEVMKTLRPDTSAEDRTKAEEKANKGSMRGPTGRARDGETVAKTEAQLQDVYKNVKRGNTGEALKQLGVRP